MEVTSLITSAKTAYDIAKGINSLKTSVERNESISKILETLLSVQTDALMMQEKHQVLLREKDELNNKLKEFEKWSDIETQYELKEIAPSIFVYAFKKTDDSTDPMHWLCTKCYKDRKASILQLARQYKEDKDYFCPSCNNEYKVRSKSSGSFPSNQGHGGPNSWMGA